MPFPWEGVWLVNWLGNWILEGGIGGCTQKWSTYIHTHDRLDKLRSALAEAQLKTWSQTELDDIVEWKNMIMPCQFLRP